MMDHFLTPWVISAFLLLFAGWVWIFYRLFRLNPIDRQLKKVIHLLEGSSQKDFCKNFKLLNVAVGELSFFQHEWRLFTANLLYPEKTGDLICYRQTPRYFFNTQTLLAAHINVRFYQGFANYLIYIGLFFTFVGLVVALYASSQGILSDDVGKIRASLQLLLQAASFKFLSSLSGIFAFLLFSWREKYHWHRMQRQIETLNRKLETYMKPMIDPVVASTTMMVPEVPVVEDKAFQVELAEGAVNQLIATQTQEMEKINTNLLMSANMGVKVLQKEIQRLNTNVSVATRRIYRAIRLVGGYSAEKADDVER
jgi:hypothetical protein